MRQIKVKVKLGTDAGTVRGLGTHLRDIGPWACGGKEPITPGLRARVTTGLPRLTFRDSEATTLPDVAYLLTARWTGVWGYRKNRPNFSTPPGDRIRDLSVVSRACYRRTTESPDETDIFKMLKTTYWLCVQLKVADVTPIFEKGDWSISFNYHRISFTSVIGKMLESLLDRNRSILRNSLIHDSARVHAK